MNEMGRWWRREGERGETFTSNHLSTQELVELLCTDGVHQSSSKVDYQVRKHPP